MGTSLQGASRGRAVLTIAALMALTGLAIGGTSVLGANATIAIEGRAFEPSAVTVAVNDVVTWTNADDVGHTVTASGSFDFGPIPPGGSHAVSFGAPSTFEYGCTIHPEMVGTIIVVGAAGASPEPAGGEVAAATQGPGITAAPTDSLGTPGDGAAGDALLTVATLGTLAFVSTLAVLVTIRRSRRGRGATERPGVGLAVAEPQQWLLFAPDDDDVPPPAEPGRDRRA